MFGEDVLNGCASDGYGDTFYLLGIDCDHAMLCDGLLVVFSLGEKEIS